MTTLVARLRPAMDFCRLPLSYESGDELVLELPRILASPNHLVRRHWAALKRECDAWEQLIYAAVRRRVGLTADAGIHAGIAPPASCRMHVAVERIVPARNFLRDDDNLQFASKSLLDALTRTRLIVDDSEQWLARERTMQRIAEDGHARTRVVLWPDVAAAS